MVVCLTQELLKSVLKLIRLLNSSAPKRNVRIANPKLSAIKIVMTVSESAASKGLMFPTVLRSKFTTGEVSGKKVANFVRGFSGSVRMSMNIQAGENAPM